MIVISITALLLLFLLHINSTIITIIIIIINIIVIIICPTPTSLQVICCVLPAVQSAARRCGIEVSFIDVLPIHTATN